VVIVVHRVQKYGAKGVDTLLSISNEPVLDEVDNTPDVGDAEGLIIEELTSLLADDIPK
jgi:hypothetical protein